MTHHRIRKWHAHNFKRVIFTAQILILSPYVDSNLDKETLLTMKRLVEAEMDKLNDLIYFYGVHEDDDEFTDLVNKAKYYRGIIERIDEDLRKFD